MVRNIAHPLPFRPSPPSKVSSFLSLHVCRRRAYLWEMGGGGGEKQFKAWPSIYNSILSEVSVYPWKYKPWKIRLPLLILHKDLEKSSLEVTQL
jgi:hypothetical protein